MARVIEIDDVERILWDHHFHDGDGLQALCDVAEILDAVRGHPGAVDIVRCKDCRWVVWSKNWRGEDMVICSNKESPVSETYRLVEPDWYCADGERWEADEDNTP